MEILTVGDVAKKAEVNIQTIRFYERRGLLPNPSRSAANYRLYSDATVVLIRFIKRAQKLGFTLKEIDELLALRTIRGSRCDEVLERAKAKAREIDEKIRDLHAIRNALEVVILECPGKGSTTQCPILNALGSES